jgi:hypothetical protein
MNAASSGRGPFQHLLIAVGIPKRENRPPPNKSIDAHRFSRAAVNEFDLAVFYKHRFVARPELVAHHAGRAHYLLRRNALDALGEDTHELHAAAEDDEGLENHWRGENSTARSSADRPARYKGD